MYQRKWKRLGDLLVDQGIITQQQLQEALVIQKESGKKLGEILANKDYVNGDKIREVLEIQLGKLGISQVQLSQFDIDAEATKMISEKLAKKHELIPIKFENNELTVAMSDPLNIYAIDDVRIFTGLEINPVIAEADEINRAIDIYYGKQEAMKAAEEYKKEHGIGINLEEVQEDNIEEMVNSAPIVKLVNYIIEQAVRIKASDIHIEPYSKDIRIRYRVDGQLQEMMRHDVRLLPAIVTRIKISGEMNIAEKRKPQDGRISIKIDKKDYDLRVSILPTVHGEKVVIRIIDKSGLLKDKESLGFLKEDLLKFDNILKSPHGIILVTGPTGSGKSTTLYTSLKELNKENINIITVEDPVESTLEGINQVQVNPKAGLDFAGALRSILRQDPDIVMIGEIRDRETVEIAVRAAVTGHLVVSTLHTNDAPSTVTRLIDMGIEPFLISTSLSGIIAQRLVRKICPVCKTEYIPAPGELDVLDQSVVEQYGGNVTLYHGTGCNKCNNSGYSGRIGVYEIMSVSQGLKQLINKGANADEIKIQAEKDGMSTLKKSCTKLVLEKITTLEELIRIAYAV